jgi:hypothetical protein
MQAGKVIEKKKTIETENCEGKWKSRLSVFVWQASVWSMPASTCIAMRVNWLKEVS